MTAWVWVGLGGAAGSLARYHLGRLVMARFSSEAPMGTFLINISGAFLLGLSTVCVHNETLRLLVADGFLGAYTTFSTLLFEGYVSVADGKRRFAAGYLAGSILFGVIVYGVGQALGRMFG